MNENVKFPPKNNDYDSDSDEEDNVRRLHGGTM